MTSFLPAPRPERKRPPAMSADLLKQMRRNPLGDWTISDVEKVAALMACGFARAGEHRTATPNILPQSKY
jgi:hypothetical protein